MRLVKLSTFSVHVRASLFDGELAGAGDFKFDFHGEEGIESFAVEGFEGGVQDGHFVDQVENLRFGKDGLIFWDVAGVADVLDLVAVGS